MSLDQDKKIDSKEDEKFFLDELKSAELKHKLLVQRLKNNKKSINDLWAVFGTRTQYYFLNIVMNALVFGVFYTLTTHSIVIYPASDFISTDINGKTSNIQHSSLISKNGEYKMKNGNIPMRDFKTILNLSGVGGCFLVMFTTKYSTTTLSYIFGVSSIGSILLGHAFSLHVFERISFFLMSVFTTAVSLLMAVRCFEAGPKPYRIFAIAFAVYLSLICFLAKLVFFQQGYGLENADKITIFVLAVLISFHAMLTPPQFVRAIVRNDFATVHETLKRFGCETRLRVTNIEALIHDTYYAGHVPNGVIDGLAHLYKIKPFRCKLAVLTILLFLEGHVRSYETHYVRLLVPMNPFESMLSSKFISTYSTIFLIAGLFYLGRRYVLLISYFVICIVFLLVVSIPMDAVSMCTNDIRPSDENMKYAMWLYFIYIIAQNSVKATLYLMTLEHIPSLYRTFTFAAVFCAKFLLHLTANLLPSGWKNDKDTHTFGYSILFYTFICLLLTLYFIDNSSFSPFSTAEIPAYQLPIRKITKKKHNKTLLMKTGEGW